jgi:hypothetical protein
MKTKEELQALVDYQNKEIDILYETLQNNLNRKYLTDNDKVIIKYITERIAEETGELERYKYQITMLNNGKEIL